MPHAAGVSANRPTIINVMDFRRQRLILEWNTLGGTWTASDDPPALVHGVALIRAAPPNICIFGREGRLHLQVGPDRFALSENSPHIRCTRGFMSFGLRNRFTIESGTGEVLYSHSFWTGQGDDFFRWLATRTADPEWRSASGRRWSEGIEPSVLRAS